MSIDFFLAKNTLAGKKGYIAHTVHRPTVGRELLIERMAGAHTSLSGPDIRGVLSLLEETVLAALLDGRAVEIGDMLKLSPMATGVLDGDDLRRAGNDPQARISSRVLPGFLRRFKAKARLEKRDPAGRTPQLHSVAAGEGESGGLHAVYPNTLRGVDLKLKYYVLSGITLARTGGGERAAVPLSQLGVHRHTVSVLSFHFTNRFSPPDWLTPGCELTAALDYRHAKSGRTLSSNALPAVWRGPEAR